MARFALVLAALLGFVAARQVDGSSARASDSPPRAPQSPAGTVVPPEPEHALLPYVSGSHVLVAPTVTPTPLPTATPVPPPIGFEARCDYSDPDDICSWLPSGEPAGGSRVEAAVRLFVNGRPAPGRKMTVRWVFPYPTLFKYCDARTGDDGVAACGVDTPRYPGQYGYAQIALAVSDWPFQRQITFRIR